MRSRRRQAEFTAASVGIKCRDCARCRPRPDRVRARRQDDRNPRAQNDPGKIGLQEKGEIFREHIAGFQIWHDKDLRPPGNLRLDAFDCRRLRVDGVVESERAIENAAGTGIGENSPSLRARVGLLSA